MGEDEKDHMNQGQSNDRKDGQKDGQKDSPSLGSASDGGYFEIYPSVGFGKATGVAMPPPRPDPRPSPFALVLPCVCVCKCVREGWMER